MVCCGMNNAPHPAAFLEPSLDNFRYTHLPARLAEISQPFCELARAMHDRLPVGVERAVMLRKLLEAKDCAVRAALESR